MSDLAPQFYDAFTDVHDNFPQQLFCTRHVEKAWKEQLKEKKSFARICYMCIQGASSASCRACSKQLQF